MLSEIELKVRLQALEQNEFCPPENEDLSELIPAMLNYIGSVDSTLRDDLIYSGFNALILRHRALNPAQLRSLLPIILDERHLFYKLGEQDTDSVFTRSFSVLILPLLLIFHRSQPLFSTPEVGQIKEKLLYYLENEKDRRGFVSEKGWAHAIAHAADALDDLAQCAELSQADLTELLEVIRKVVCVENAYYVHLEEERLTTAVVAILKRDLLPEAEINQWIEGFSDLTFAAQLDPGKHIIRTNVKNFLQSLYFRLQWEQMNNDFGAPINQTLRRINPFTKQENS